MKKAKGHFKNMTQVRLMHNYLSSVQLRNYGPPKHKIYLSKENKTDIDQAVVQAFEEKTQANSSKLRKALQKIESFSTLEKLASQTHGLSTMIT